MSTALVYQFLYGSMSIFNGCGVFQNFLVGGVIFFKLLLVFLFSGTSKAAIEENKKVVWPEGRKKDLIHCFHCKNSLFLWPEW